MKQVKDTTLARMDIRGLADYVEEGRPNWFQPDIWKRLIQDHQATNGFCELSKKNKKNRLTKKGSEIICHVDQSINLEIHEKYLV